MYDNFISLCNRLSESWISWMGLSILETTLLLAILSGLWLLVRKRSSPQLGYLLFLLIPLRLLLPLDVPLPGITIPWQTTAVPTDTVVPPANTPEPFTTDVLPQHNQSAAIETAVATEPQPIISPSEPAPTRKPVRAVSRLAFSSWLMLAWAGGVLWLTGRFLRSQHRLSILLRNSNPIDPETLGIDLTDLCRRMGTGSVRVLESDGVASPSVAGLRRPVIVLPVGVLNSLSVAQREWILLHELAHIRRKDLFVNLFQRLATFIFFPNPAVWLANRQIGRLCEYACDDLASALSGASQIESSEAFLWVMKSAQARKRTGLLRSAAALGMSRSFSQSECYQRMTRLLESGDRPALKLGRRSLALLALSAVIALPHLRAVEPTSTLSSNNSAFTAEQKNDAEGDGTRNVDSTDKPLEPAPYEFSVIVAEHVLLLDGKTITTWEGLARHIESVPEPLYVYPHFYITRGAMEAGKYEQAKQKIWNLHKDYNLKGHSEGSLWPRTDIRFDRIKTADDLKPNPALRTTGTILFDGKPVSGAEVVLVTPVDESIEYKTYHIALVEGHIRNRMEHVMTLSDEQGHYTLYPPRDTPYYIMALHPDAGFALMADGQIPDDGQITLRKWGGVEVSFEDPKNEQEANLTTSIQAYDGRPEISINQYWSDLRLEEKPRVFQFKHVPTIYNTAISRSFPQPDGGATSLSAATISLFGGEMRKIDFGEVTQEQLDFLKAIRGPFSPPEEQPKE